MQVIDLLYPQPSQLLLSRIIAGYQVKNSKRTSRTRELEINMSRLKFDVDFFVNRPQYKFQLDGKPHTGTSLVALFGKVSSREIRGQAALTNF